MYDSSFFMLRHRYRELLSSFLSTSVPSTNDRYALIWNCNRSNTYCIRKKRHTQNTSRQQTTPKEKQIRQLIMRNLLPLIPIVNHLFLFSTEHCWIMVVRWSLFHCKAKSSPRIYYPLRVYKKLCICYRSNLISGKVWFNLGWFSISFVV